MGETIEVGVGDVVSFRYAGRPYSGKVVATRARRDRFATRMATVEFVTGSGAKSRELFCHDIKIEVPAWVAKWRAINKAEAAKLPTA